MPADSHDPITIYNKQAVWDELCAPVLHELVVLCSIHEIPQFVKACIRNDRNGPLYVNDMVNPDVRGIILKEDHIPKHLAVMRGYDVCLPDKSGAVPQMEDMDEIFLE